MELYNIQTQTLESLIVTYNDPLYKRQPANIM